MKKRSREIVPVGDSGSGALAPLTDEQRARRAQADAELRDIFAAARAAATHRGYASDWKTFEFWCEQMGHADPFGLTGEEIGAYLTQLASGSLVLTRNQGRKPRPKGSRRVATVERHLATLSFAYAEYPHPEPRKPLGEEPAVVKAMKGIRSTHGRAQARKAPALASDLAAAVARLPDKPIGLRDRAILLLGFASAFRRGNIASIQINELTFDARGVTIKLPHSKTDQARKGRDVRVLRGESGTCPVAAVEAWLAWLAGEGIADGALFRQLGPRDRYEKKPIHDKLVARAVKRAFASIGRNPAEFGGHSLRAGFVTSAVQSEKPLYLVAKHVGHSSMRTTEKYIRGDVTDANHPGKGLL